MYLPRNLSLIDTLQFFLYALKLGFVDQSEITAWADDQILQEDKPAYLLIELSLLKENRSADTIESDIVSFLTNKTPQQLTKEAAHALLGLIYERLLKNAITDELTVDAMNTVKDSGALSEEEENIIDSLGYNCCCEATFFLTDVTLDFLKKYSSVNR